MKKNKVTHVHLNFCDSISEGYKVQLEKVVEEVIEANNLEYKTPFINFPGLDDKKYQKLKYLYNLNYKK
uniref:Uncharacterized protein n=1 Tax=Panagrolaimus sp. ES5 TaxID=591445 RepID=A0AC34G836_9BILA